MIRSSLLILLSLTFIGTTGVGCSSKEEAPPTKVVQMPTGRDAVIGHWVKGRRSMHLRADNSFNWTMVRPCGAPPCKIAHRAGTWRLAGKNIQFTLNNGNGIKVGYHHTGPPRQLHINNHMYNTKVVFNRAN